MEASQNNLERVQSDVSYTIEGVHFDTRSDGERLQVVDPRLLCRGVVTKSQPGFGRELRQESRDEVVLQHQWRATQLSSGDFLRAQANIAVSGEQLLLCYIARDEAPQSSDRNRKDAFHFLLVMRLFSPTLPEQGWLGIGIRVIFDLSFVMLHSLAANHAQSFEPVEQHIQDLHSNSGEACTILLKVAEHSEEFFSRALKRKQGFSNRSI
jgi:hypothetical protein